MKKTIFTIAVVGLLLSCGGKKVQGTDEQLDNVPQQSSEVLSDDFDNAHNAKNSLDFIGIYKGTLPAANGSSMEVTVELKDSTYVRTTTYLKNNKKTVNEGSYAWDSTGSIITLEKAESANMYFVGENTLTALDADGKKIEEELAAQYKLTKQ